METIPKCTPSKELRSTQVCELPVLCASTRIKWFTCPIPQLDLWVEFQVEVTIGKQFHNRVTQ